MNAAGTGIRHHCGATGDEFKGRRDVPSTRQPRVGCPRSRAAPRCGQRRSASVLRRVRVLRSGLGGACVRGVANDPYTVSRRAPTSMQLKPSTLCPIAPRRIVRAPQPTAPRRLPQLHQTDGQGPAERPAAARRSRSEEAEPAGGAGPWPRSTND